MECGNENKKVTYYFLMKLRIPQDYGLIVLKVNGVCHPIMRSCDCVARILINNSEVHCITWIEYKWLILLCSHRYITDGHFYTRHNSGLKNKFLQDGQQMRIDCYCQHEPFFCEIRNYYLWCLQRILLIIILAMHQISSQCARQTKNYREEL